MLDFAFRGQEAVSCWILSQEVQRVELLKEAVSSLGWKVDFISKNPMEVLQRMIVFQAPDVLITGLLFDHNDSLRVIRELGKKNPNAGVYFASREQVSVIKSAVNYANLCGLTVVGYSSEPSTEDTLVSELKEYIPVKTTKIARHVVAPPSQSDLLEILADRRLQAWMQPQVSLKSNEIVGFEALMRGISLSDEIIGPDLLVPAFERAGLMNEVTLEMLRQTVAFVFSSLKNGNAITGSVNVSLTSLSDPDFCRALPMILEQSGLDPSWITLEITESDAMANICDVVENTTRIRMLGFNLAIDDFGTGYSSLAQLLAIPFSELKLDRCFIQDIDRNVQKQMIVQACSGMSSKLGLNIVAEGVETDSEWRTVLASGCTHIQGYRVSKPLPATEAHAWLKSFRNQVWV